MTAQHDGCKSSASNPTPARLNWSLSMVREITPQLLYISHRLIWDFDDVSFQVPVTRRCWFQIVRGLWMTCHTAAPSHGSCLTSHRTKVSLSTSFSEGAGWKFILMCVVMCCRARVCRGTGCSCSLQCHGGTEVDISGLQHDWRMRLLITHHKTSVSENDWSVWFFCFPFSRLYSSLYVLRTSPTCQWSWRTSLKTAEDLTRVRSLFSSVFPFWCQWLCYIVYM